MFKRISTRGRWGRKSNPVTNAGRNAAAAARACTRAAGAALEPLEGRLYMFATDGRWTNEQPAGPGTPLALRYSYSNLLDGGLPTASGFGTTAQIRSAIEEALGVWTAVAPIQLTEVTDFGPPAGDGFYAFSNFPELRIGHHPMDGTGSNGLDTLAHGYLPNFWNFTFMGAIAGDLHLDDGDTWGNGSAGGVDMIETAAHELGHALGMAHANGDTRDLDGDGFADCPPPTPALMDACISNSYSGPGTSFLFSDDVNGIRSLYGAGLGYVLDSSRVLHINGTGGNDSISISNAAGMITVSSAGNGSFTRPSIDLAGISVMCRGGNDSVTINSAPAGVGITVEGDAGNDSLFVGSSVARKLSDVGGLVTFAGGAGSDRIGLNDQNGAAGSTYTFGSTSASRPGWAGANYSSVETVDIGGAGGNCVYNVNGMPAGSSMTIDDGQGIDTLNVAPAGANLDAVGATVNFHGLGVNGNWVELFDQNNSFSQSYTFENNSVDRAGGFGRVNYGGTSSLRLHSGNGGSTFDFNDLFANECNIWAGGGNDTVRLSPAAGSANNIHGQLFVDGEGGSDQILVNDRSAGAGTDADWTLDGASLDKSNPDPGKMVSWAGVEQLRLDGGGGGTTYTVKALAAGTGVTLNAGNGNDTFNVGSPAASARNVDGIQSALVLNGEAGTNALNYNDQDNSFLPAILILPTRPRPNPRGDTYTLTPTTVTRDRSAVVTYAGIQTLAVNGGTEANDFNVTPSAATTFFVHGNNPSTLPVPLPFPDPFPFPLPFPFPFPFPPTGSSAGAPEVGSDLQPIPIDPLPFPFPFPDPEPQWDRLNVNLAGTTSPSLTGGIAGTYTFADRMPVNFTGMESVNAPPSVVAGRQVFYNRSVYDGNDAAANAADDAAVAPDKQALLPGQTATFANYTTYSRGINGVMVDIAGLPASSTPSAADFSVRVGMAADATSWPAGPAPTSVSVRRGAGAGGSDRVTLVFADNAIRTTWMQVTVLANANTALAAPDVFYFGNLPGEVGNNPSAAIVNALDLGQTRSVLNTNQSITGRNDFNRDGRVNSLDLGVVRASLLQQIPTYAAPPAAGAGLFGSMPIRHEGLLAGLA